MCVDKMLDKTVYKAHGSTISCNIVTECCLVKISTR